jgi:hypothetical protein
MIDTQDSHTPGNGAPLPFPKADIVYRQLSDGAVLFSVSDELYIGLNNVAAYIWEALPPVNHTVEALCSQLAAQYPDVDHKVLRADVEEILAEFEEMGLVTRDRGATSQ